MDLEGWVVARFVEGIEPRRVGQPRVQSGAAPGTGLVSSGAVEARVAESLVSVQRSLIELDPKPGFPRSC